MCISHSNDHQQYKDITEKNNQSIGRFSHGDDTVIRMNLNVKNFARHTINHVATNDILQRSNKVIYH